MRTAVATTMGLEIISKLYHFTDRRNIESIREWGGLYSLEKIREKEIPVVAPGGNDWSHDADVFKGLDKYVHLCLRRNHPMEYRAREEGRIGSSIFLEIDRQVLEVDGVMFTTDVSNKRDVELYQLSEADDLIDSEVLGPNMDYRNKEMLERLRQAEKCEILIPDFIPVELIRNI